MYPLCLFVVLAFLVFTSFPFSIFLFFRATPSFMVAKWPIHMQKAFESRFHFFAAG